MIRIFAGQADLLPLLKESVIHGGSVSESHAEVYDNKGWHGFAEVTGPIMKAAAIGMSDLVDDVWIRARGGVKVLDSACGSGAYGYDFAQRQKDAKGISVTFLDFPGVLAITKENKKDYPDTGAVSFDYKSADLFVDSIGGPYDVIFASHIFHQFNTTRAKQLATIYANALAPGGKLLINEMLRSDSKPGITDDPTSHMFDLSLLTWTKSGQAYSYTGIKEVIDSVPSLKFERFHSNWPMPWTFVSTTKK